MMPMDKIYEQGQKQYRRQNNKPGRMMPCAGKMNVLPKHEAGGRAMRLHPFYRGKIEIGVKCKVRFTGFCHLVFAGVALLVRPLRQTKSQFINANKGNFVAVVSDGTRVLGLGTLGRKLHCR